MVGNELIAGVGDDGLAGGRGRVVIAVFSHLDFFRTSPPTGVIPVDEKGIIVGVDDGDCIIGCKR